MCLRLWIHSQNFVSSHCRTASEYHPTNACVVLPSIPIPTEDHRRFSHVYVALLVKFMVFSAAFGFK